MVRRTAYPFRTLDTAAVSSDPWLVSVDGRPADELHMWISDWAYNSRLRFQRKLAVNWHVAAEQLQIPAPQLALCVLVTAGTGPGTIPQRLIHLAPMRISKSTPEVLIEFEPDSRQLSQRLQIATNIALTETPARCGRLSPTLVGARIWADEVDVRLEGDEPRFPMEVVSFTAMFGNQAAASKAPWFLQWNPGDPNRDLHGAVRLYLNEDMKDVVDRITSGDSHLIQAMLADVISQLVENAISQIDAYGDLQSCEPGSIGSTVMTWINQAWPGESLTAIRSSLEYQPGRMRAAMLAVADVGEMEGA